MNRIVIELASDKVLVFCSLYYCRNSKAYIRIIVLFPTWCSTSKKNQEASTLLPLFVFSLAFGLLVFCVQFLFWIFLPLEGPMPHTLHKMPAQTPVMWHRTCKDIFTTASGVLCQKNNHEVISFFSTLLYFVKRLLERFVKWKNTKVASSLFSF